MKAEQTVKAQTQQDADVATEPKLSIVKFHQTKIQCCIDPDGVVYVALKPICDAIGIHADKAYESIKRDKILGAKATVRWVLDAKKRKFPMQTLPIEFVHGWLFSIDASKVSTQAKPKLLKFKEECYQVLFNHFYGKYRVYESNLAERRKLETLIDEACVQKAEISAQINNYRKRLKEINESELSGQLQLQVKGGASHE